MVSLILNWKEIKLCLCELMLAMLELFPHSHMEK